MFSGSINYNTFCNLISIRKNLFSLYYKLFRSLIDTIKNYFFITELLLTTTGLVLLKEASTSLQFYNKN